jgi:hypothetical protein
MKITAKKNFILRYLYTGLIGHIITGSVQD